MPSDGKIAWIQIDKPHILSDPGLQKRVHIGKLFWLTYVVGTQENRLNETVLLSAQNTSLNWWVRK